MFKHSSEIESHPFFKESFLLFLVCFLVFLKRFFLLNFDINYEEGKEIECALNILKGNLVFRDFHWQYGPLGIYLIALLFKGFGQFDLWVPRGLVSFIAICTTFFSFKTARFYLKPSWAFWATLLASSGLAARENTYGHGFAYLGMIASFYYLLKYFQATKRFYLAIAGLWVAITFLAKPVVFGFGALAVSLTCLWFWHGILEVKGKVFEPVCYLLLFGLLPAGIVYGYLTWETSLETIFYELMPISSGTLNFGEKRFIKPLFPIFNSLSPSQLISSLNYYLVNDFRWWLIIFTFFGGGRTYDLFIKNIKGGSSKFDEKLFPFTLFIIDRKRDIDFDKSPYYFFY